MRHPYSTSGTKLRSHHVGGGQEDFKIHTAVLFLMVTCQRISYVHSDMGKLPQHDTLDFTLENYAEHK